MPTSTNSTDIEINAVYRNYEAGFDVRAVPNPDYRGGAGDRFVVQMRPDIQSPWERPVDRYDDADSACERVAEYLTWTKSPFSV
jgi:hypothetical protein